MRHSIASAKQTIREAISSIFSRSAPKAYSKWDHLVIARQRLGVQHELAARRAGIGGGDRDLDAELIGRAGVALADALDLGSMEGIQLPAALALLLRADLARARDRPDECLFEFHPIGDLAADVADDAAEARAQEAQLPTMTVELLGVGVAPRHHPI